MNLMIRVFFPQSQAKEKGLFPDKSPTDSQFVAWRMLLKYLYQEGMLISAEVPEPYVYNDMPRIFEASFSFEIGDKTDSPLDHWSGHGNSRDFTIALSKALGETLERYFLLRFKKKNFLKASYDELKKIEKVVDLFEIPTFHDWQIKQFPALGFQPKSPLRWIESQQIFSNRSAERILVPAQIVFWGYRSDDPMDEQILGFSTTNGAGGYFSREGAILSGLHELIQRDAFMIHWLQYIAPPRIDPDSIDEEELRLLLQELKRYKYEIVLLYTTLDIAVPSITAVLIDKTGNETVFSVGGGTGFSVAHAIRQAIYEALSISTVLRDGKVTLLPKEYKPFLVSGINKRERIRFWRGKDAEERISFFLEGKKISYADAKKNEKKFKNQKEELNYLLNIFERKGKGYEVYVYEAKDPVLDKIGYHVVRTIVPRLFPIYLTEHHAPIKSIRLSEVPVKLGYNVPENFNPWPHPFP